MAGKSTYHVSKANALAAHVAAGATIKEAARRIGVHPSTVYRWQNRYPSLEAQLRRAARRRFWLTHPITLREHLFGSLRLRVPWSRYCPICGSGVEVRTACPFRFWRCERWPDCSFASWRPPTGGRCPECGDPLYWSHSRKSIRCDGCGHTRRINSLVRL